MTKLAARRRVMTAAPARGVTLAQRLLMLHLALSPLLFWRGCSDPFELVKFSWLILTVILLAALGISRSLAAPPGGWRLTDLGVGLFVLSVTASTMNSLSWRYSVWGTMENRVGLLAVVALAGLFWATRYCCNTAADRRRLLLAIPIAGLLGGTYAVVQAAGLDPFAWTDVSQVAGHERPAGSLGHPNMLGTFLAMALPITLAFARQHFAINRRHALLFVAIAMVESAPIVLTLSRAAWLAALIAGAVLLVGWRPRWKWVAVSLLPILFVAVLAGHPLLERARHFADPSGRLHIWKAAAQVFRERPLLGCGPEAFQLAFAPHRTPEFWAVEWGATPAKAHNEPLHLLATQGLLGIAAALILFVGLLRDGRAAWRESGNEERTWSTAIIAGLAGFAVQAQFGYSTIGVLTGVITLAGALRISPGNQTTTRLTLSPLLRWLIWIPAGLLIYWLVWLPIAASSACRDGDELLSSDPDAVRTAFARACELDPRCDAHWSRRAQAAITAAERDPANRWQLQQDARSSFVRAIHLTPLNAFHHHNFAVALSDISPSEAFAEFDEALRIDPMNAEFALDAARQAIRHHDVDRACKYIDRGLAAHPNNAALRAESAYVLLLRDRPADALVELDIALTSDWHGDADAESRARSVKERCRNALLTSGN